ncbi:MAG: ABC transporter permease [Bacteroidales bacterium]|nr:ABC transporter permease [Bacteroidales bacterium]HOL97679.1 ABC transporter permease [Bacteroidales bacterium]HOM37247.1 ABC transporter permease [Bacteroidales bacterium]HPD24808.1 ABC transporter permease [Bacteroidales bacterium]HRT00347.1 ABC transporter permease [Bacteroidales bacterium]
MKKDFKYLINYLLGSLALLFIVAPIINMYFAADLDKIFSTARDSEVRNSIFFTLLISFLSTIVFALFSIPLAYLISKSKSWLKTILLGLVNIPIVIPHSAAGIALLGLVSRENPVGKFASSIGLNFVDSPLGIAIAMAYVSVPFLIISAYTGFKEIPEDLELASRNLGATRWQTFLNISIPLSGRSILAGIILMFSRGISEFGAVIMLAYFPTVTPVLIYKKFTTHGLEFAQPIALIFITICLLIFVVYYLFGIIGKNKS